jgi:hypothetical protein
VEDHDATARLAVVDKLLATCPHLRDSWNQSRTDDDEEPLAYPQAATLAGVVVAALRSGDTSCFKALFEEVERIISAGTPNERELVIVGFLEDLQGAMGWAAVDLTEMESWLGPQAREAWIELIKMWAEIRRKKASGELPAGPFDISESEIKDPALRRIFRQVDRPPHQRDDK